MDTPKQGNRLPAGVTWAADNGAFTERGRAGFTVAGYLDWLAGLAWARATCLFATAPDVLCDPAGTWAASAPVLPAIRALGYPAALVAQNGIEDTPMPWGSFDALFLGGDTTWKLGPAAAGLVREANARGKWTHMGRVNSALRYRYAAAIGCDSADGTFVAFAPDANLPQAAGWVRTHRTQTTLFDLTSEGTT